jgi:hypothetical protein
MIRSDFPNRVFADACDLSWNILKEKRLICIVIYPRGYFNKCEQYEPIITIICQIFSDGLQKSYSSSLPVVGASEAAPGGKRTMQCINRDRQGNQWIREMCFSST